MLKGFLVGVVAGVLLVLTGTWFYFTTGRAPVAVTDPPLPFEERLAHRAMHAHIDRQPRTEAAVPADETNLLAGVEVYKQNCAICHGLPGAAETAIAKGMFPDPPQLFGGDTVTDDPVWETYWKATNGIRLTGMPGFKAHLTVAQMWQVSQLLAHADKLPAAVKAALASASAAKPVNTTGGETHKEK